LTISWSISGVANIEGVSLKLNRSRQHIAELENKSRNYLDSEPFRVIQSEEENGDLVWRIKIQKQVPLEFSAIVGDGVHNMRSALDLLAWQLVELNGGTPTRQTYFPISSKPPAEYDQELRRALGGASSAAFRFVRRLKPYRGGNETLGQLHALDITDKHRLILLVGAAHKHVVIKFKMPVPWKSDPVDFPPIAMNPADRQFPLKDNSAVFRVKADARDSPLPFEHGLVFELAFGDVAEVSGLPLLPTLDSMHRQVSKIVEITRRLFFDTT
jgi:hypothetical protein